MAYQQLQEHHPEVDWSKWSPPGDSDVRSPCPAINALANHNILPHNGKTITKAMAVEALTTAYHFDPLLANIFSTAAVATNPDQSAHSFDLSHINKHNLIEHDASLSRGDAAFGNNFKFDKELFDEFLRGIHARSGDMTTWKSAGQVRYERVKASKARHAKEGRKWGFGLKEVIVSYGETALYLILLGKNGVAPTKWIKIFFEEERLPYEDGWTPPPTFDQSSLNHAYAELIKANEHKLEEFKLVGMGSLEVLSDPRPVELVNLKLGSEHFSFTFRALALFVARVLGFALGLAQWVFWIFKAAGWLLKHYVLSLL